MSRRPLVPEQQALADLVDNVSLFATRLDVICKQCNKTLGRVVDTGIALGDQVATTQLGAILNAFRFDPDLQAERHDPSGHGKVALTNKWYSDTTPYVAFLEGPTARSLPAALPVCCDRHGSRTVLLADLRSLLERARQGEKVPPVRV